jgi:uncharacterized protein with GYD domain
MIFIERSKGDNVAKFALANGMTGNVRSRTVRTYPADEYMKIIADLP